MNTHDLQPIQPRQVASQREEEIIPLFGDLPENPGRNPAERINFWYETFQRALGISLAAGLRAGHELCLVRESVGTRGFSSWIENNLSFKRAHAYRFITAFEQTVEKHRLALPEPVPLSAPLTEEEVRGVAAEFGATTFRGLQKALSPNNNNHGGARPGAGRPPKDLAKEIEEIRTDPDVLFAPVEEALLVLLDFTGEAKHERLSDAQLTRFLAAVKQLEAPLAATLKARVRYGGSAK